MQSVYNFLSKISFFFHKLFLKVSLFFINSTAKLQGLDPKELLEEIQLKEDLAKFSGQINYTRGSSDFDINYSSVREFMNKMPEKYSKNIPENKSELSPDENQKELEKIKQLAMSLEKTEDQELNVCSDISQDNSELRIVAQEV